jgi:hypothetical protein
MFCEGLAPGLIVGADRGAMAEKAAKVIALDVKVILIPPCILLVILHTRYTGARQNDCSAHAYQVTTTQRQDARELRAWVAEAAVGESRELELSQSRRLHLHRTCIALEAEGHSLTHESAGETRAAGESAIKCPFPLNVLKDTHGHRMVLLSTLR